MKMDREVEAPLLTRSESEIAIGWDWRAFGASYENRFARRPRKGVCIAWLEKESGAESVAVVAGPGVAWIKARVRRLHCEVCQTDSNRLATAGI
jgi:hypothetical protein